MKNILFIAVILVAVSITGISCKDSAKIKEEQLGHWVSKEFTDAVKSNANISSIQIVPAELVFRRDDSVYQFIVLGKGSTSGRYFPDEKGNLRATNFASSQQDYEFRFKSDSLVLINLTTDQHTSFHKVSDAELGVKGSAEKHISHLLLWVNQQLFAGQYTIGVDTITLQSDGYIVGWGAYKSFSLCYNQLCKNASGSSTIFLANQRNEGDYFDYEMKSDSLIIYGNSEADTRLGKSKRREGIILSAKKIN